MFTQTFSHGFVAEIPLVEAHPLRDLLNKLSWQSPCSAVPSLVGAIVVTIKDTTAFQPLEVKIVLWHSAELPHVRFSSSSDASTSNLS